MMFSTLLMKKEANASAGLTRDVGNKGVVSVVSCEKTLNKALGVLEEFSIKFM